MAETNFTLHSTDSNNYKLQKTFTGVNPDATSAELVATAQGLNRLTDNTYIGTKRIDKIDADSEAGTITTKTTPTFTLEGNTATATSIKSATSGQYGVYKYCTYDGDADIADFYATGASDLNVMAGFATEGNNRTYVTFRAVDSTKNVLAGTITLHAPETANYNAVTATFTVTAS